MKKPKKEDCNFCVFSVDAQKQFSIGAYSGVTDDFFDETGHSRLLAKPFNKIQENLAYLYSLVREITNIPVAGIETLYDNQYIDPESVYYLLSALFNDYVFGDEPDFYQLNIRPSITANNFKFNLEESAKDYLRENDFKSPFLQALKKIFTGKSKDNSSALVSFIQEYFIQTPKVPTNLKKIPVGITFTTPERKPSSIQNTFKECSLSFDLTEESLKQFEQKYAIVGDRLEKTNTLTSNLCDYDSVKHYARYLLPDNKNGFHQHYYYDDFFGTTDDDTIVTENNNNIQPVIGDRNATRVWRPYKNTNNAYFHTWINYVLRHPSYLEQQRFLFLKTESGCDNPELWRFYDYLENRYNTELKPIIVGGLAGDGACVNETLKQLAEKNHLGLIVSDLLLIRGDTASERQAKLHQTLALAKQLGHEVVNFNELKERLMQQFKDKINLVLNSLKHLVRKVDTKSLDAIINTNLNLPEITQLKQQIREANSIDAVLDSLPEKTRAEVLSIMKSEQKKRSTGTLDSDYIYEIINKQIEQGKGT